MCFMILLGPHAKKRYGSSVIAQSAFNKSDFRILWSSTSVEGIHQYLVFIALTL